MIEFAKEWRTDRILRRLEALMIVGNEEYLLVLSGNGEVIEPDEGIAAIGSGGAYAAAAAKRSLAQYQTFLQGRSSSRRSTSPRRFAYTRTSNITVDEL